MRRFSGCIFEHLLIVRLLLLHCLLLVKVQVTVMRVVLLGTLVMVMHVVLLGAVCLESKRENYQICSVQYCVQQLCTVKCTHI